MASVAELKAVLENEQTKLAELSEKSIEAIGFLLNLSSWVLTVLAVVLAIIGIIGWTVIHKSAISKCQTMAKDYLEKYIQGDAFKTLVEDKVAEALKSNWQDTIVSTTLDTNDKSQEQSPFPAVEKKGGAL